MTATEKPIALSSRIKIHEINTETHFRIENCVCVCLCRGRMLCCVMRCGLWCRPDTTTSSTVFVYRTKVVGVCVCARKTQARECVYLCKCVRVCVLSCICQIDSVLTRGSEWKYLYSALNARRAKKGKKKHTHIVLYIYIYVYTNTHAHTFVK